MIPYSGRHPSPAKQATKRDILRFLMVKQKLDFKSEQSPAQSGKGPDLISVALNVIPRAAAPWGLLGLAAYALIRSLDYARMRPLSVDELFTQAVCRQTDLPAIWKALSQGTDGQPPFFYLMERSMAWHILNEHIGYRLLPVAGFVCTLILLFVFVKTRNGPGPALICAALLLMTPLFNIYAVEARPYSPLIACVAFALVCYQRTPAAPWVGALFLSLFLASALHYYAVFAFLPFFVAELMVLFKLRNLRFWVWFALLAALTPLGICWPLVMRMRQLWAAHFFAHYGLGTLPMVYAGYLLVSPVWGTAIVGAAFAAILATFVSNSPQRENSQGVPAPERVLLLGLMVLPIVGYAAAKLTHAPFIDRYFLAAILGIFAAAGYVLGRALAKNVMVAAMIVLLGIGAQELGFWMSPHHTVIPDEQISPLVGLAESVHHEDLPIVISSFADYLEFSHYAPPRLRRRIVVLADPANAVIYTGADTADQLAVAWRSYQPEAVPDFASFASENPAFLLYSSGNQFDWWPARLAHDGHQLKLLARRGVNSMYLVELKAPVKKSMN